MSGGECQRVAIARALVRQPRVVLADEPTSVLDRRTGREIVELLRDLAKRQRCTILMVTHDTRILNVADRVMMLDDGQLSPASDPSSLHLLPELFAPESLKSRADRWDDFTDAAFRDLLNAAAGEAEQFLTAVEGILGNSSEVLTGGFIRSALSRLAAHLNAGGAALFTVDGDRDTLRQRCAVGQGAAAAPSEISIDGALNGHDPESGARLPAGDGALSVPLLDRRKQLIGMVRLSGTRNGAAVAEADETILRDLTRILTAMVQVLQCMDMEHPVAVGQIDSRSRPA
jgi:putative ABC transport system ATP-binding protein